VALTGPQRTIKRGIDIVGALVGLVVSSPILPVACLAIRRHDHGPALFRQERVGLHGDTFVMVKLRTMRTDAEALRAVLPLGERGDGARFKRADDPRVTRPGRLLRATSERFEDLERHDLFYIENWSVLDPALLSRTVGGVLGRAWRLSRGGGDR